MVDRGTLLASADIARLSPRRQWEVFGAYLTAGQLEPAAACLEQLTNGQSSVILLRARERLAEQRGDQAARLVAVRERADSFPGPEHQADLALMLLETGAITEAATVLATALTIYAPSSTLLVAAGQLALKQGDARQADRAATRALEQEPDHIGAHCLLIQADWQTGQLHAARQRLSNCVERLAGSATPADLAALAATADAIDDLPLGEALRARLNAYWQRRRDATWQAVAQELGQPVLAHAQSNQDDGRPPAAVDADPSPRPLSPVAATTDEPEESGLSAAVLAIVREQFGHASLRPGQADVLRQVLAGVDTLATMPTGAGKSLCYQVAALARPGTTLVISPLIALMKDQVDSLPPTVAAVSTLINSTLDVSELHSRLEAVRAGRYKLVYVAPERLRSSGFLGAMRAAGVGLVVVDEAHCISLWGPDFRPDYLFIPRAAAVLGDPPLLAMTATATAALAADIERQMRRPLRQVRTSVFRPNLRYVVRRVDNREAKFRAVLDLCQRTTGPGIIYASSRETCEQITTMLRREGIRADYYHAGLERDRRADVQDAFMQGRVRVIVATVAFGMGVDKRNVRFIVHFSPPKSLEAYAQESGRAGRDGGNALCLLLYAAADISNLKRWSRQDQIEAATVLDVYRLLSGWARQAGSRWLIASPASLLGEAIDPDSDIDVPVVIGLLERAGLLNRHPDAPRTLILRLPGASQAVPDRLLVRLLQHVEFVGSSRTASVSTARLAEALVCSPADLERHLDDWSLAGQLDRQGRERETCLELLPSPADARQRITTLLVTLQRENAQRLKSLIAYLEAGECRHALLAAHFGEQIAACGDACDNCSRGSTTTGTPARVTPKQRVTGTVATVDDAAQVLAAVRTVPFRVGKKGLARLLAGSIQSPIGPERSTAFGALDHLSLTRIEQLIELLVDHGLLHRDEASEYRLLSLTDQGEQIDAADLVTMMPRPASPRSTERATAHASSGRPLTDGNEVEDWDADQRALFERLRRWRTETADAAGVPAYVVMHNSVLRQLITSRPATLADLERIPGLGPTRSERYGTALLAIVAGPLDRT
jgi:ATP-dependent DNA helicase RecQ